MPKEIPKMQKISVIVEKPLKQHVDIMRYYTAEVTHETF